MVEGNLLTAIAFTPKAIFTVSRAAQMKIWQRPPRQANPLRGRRKPQGGSQSGNALLATPGTGTGGLGGNGGNGGMKSPRGDVVVAA